MTRVSTRGGDKIMLLVDVSPLLTDEICSGMAASAALSRTHTGFAPTHTHTAFIFNSFVIVQLGQTSEG